MFDGEGVMKEYESPKTDPEEAGEVAEDVGNAGLVMDRFLSLIHI